MARICLIEDDPTIREFVSNKLRNIGHEVEEFAAAESVPERHWDLYVVDIMLSGEETGLDFCKRLRSKIPTVPILILSALSEPPQRVEGLRAGADDYLGKPFEMDELVLRVEGMLKRSQWYDRMPSDHTSFEWEGRGVDFARFEAKVKNEVIPLSQKEAMLMKLLVEKEGEVVSRDEILDKVWGYNAFPSTRTVDNFIVKLRKVFEEDTDTPRYIHSIRGLGYKFTSRPI